MTFELTFCEGEEFRASLGWPFHRQGAKVRTSISASRNRMQQQHATPTTTDTQFYRTHNFNSFNALPLLCALTQVAMIATSCTQPAPVLILSWSVVVVVVVEVTCCCCILFQLALMLVLTLAPCTLTCAPCACGDCHQQQLTVVFFLPPTGADTELTLGQLALCSGGFWWWWWYL